MVMFLTFLAFRRTSRCEAQSNMSFWAFFRTTFSCSASRALFSLSFSIQHSLKMLPVYQKHLFSFEEFLKQYLFELPECIFRRTCSSDVKRHDLITSSSDRLKSHRRWKGDRRNTLSKILLIRTHATLFFYFFRHFIFYFCSFHEDLTHSESSLIFQSPTCRTSPRHLSWRSC